MAALLVKIALLAILDALAVYAVFVLVGLHQWAAVVVTMLITGLINWIYLGGGKRLPAKYLTPGVIFLVVFQVFVVLFSGYIAFTNYSDGHNSTKEDAVNSIIQVAEKRVADSPAYQLSVLESGGTYSFLVTDPKGVVKIGSADQPLSPTPDAKLDSTGKAVGLDGYTTLNLSQILANQAAITAVRVPFSDNPSAGALRTDDANAAYVYRSTLTYDAKADTFTDTDGVVYINSGKGSFATADGSKTLSPGWKVDVGIANFVKAFTNKQISGPLWRVIVWTFAFAILSVLATFALGLFLAIVLNHPTLRGKKFYRVLVILPYAFPAFLSGLVWAGLLNPQFGFINQVIFGGADIPWLTEPWLARFSVILVNLWLGYPYMFLVCTGALQRGEPVAGVPVHQAAAAAGVGCTSAHCVVRVQLQQLQRDLHAHEGVAPLYRHDIRHRIDRPADHHGLQGGIRSGRCARLRARERPVDPDLPARRGGLDHRVQTHQGTRGDQLRWLSSTPASPHRSP
jgi:arabinogalactan oligomer/maltooligosaccharide transport system permease protein